MTGAQLRASLPKFPAAARRNPETWCEPRADVRVVEYKEKYHGRPEMDSAIILRLP
jgi:hypothetical protein